MRNGREIHTEFLRSMMQLLATKVLSEDKIHQTQINGLTLALFNFLMVSLTSMTETSLNALVSAKSVILIAMLDHIQELIKMSEDSLILESTQSFVSKITKI